MGRLPDARDAVREQNLSFMNRLIAGCAAAATVCGGLGFAGLGPAAGIAQANPPGCSQYSACWCPGQKMPAGGHVVGDWDMNACHDYHFSDEDFPPGPTCRQRPARSRVTPVARPGRRSSADRHSAAASEALLLRNPSAKKFARLSRRRLTPVGELCLFSKNCGLYSRSLAYSSNCQAYIACPSLGVSAISRKSHERRAKTAIQRSGR